EFHGCRTEYGVCFESKLRGALLFGRNVKLDARLSLRRHPGTDLYVHLNRAAAGGRVIEDTGAHDEVVIRSDHSWNIRGDDEIPFDFRCSFGATDALRPHGNRDDSQTFIEVIRNLIANVPAVRPDIEQPGPEGDGRLALLIKGIEIPREAAVRIAARGGE